MEHLGPEGRGPVILKPLHTERHGQGLLLTEGKVMSGSSCQNADHMPLGLGSGSVGCLPFSNFAVAEVTISVILVGDDLRRKAPTLA